MKPNKYILIMLLLPIIVLHHGEVEAGSESVVEYDIYEMAESGMLIKFPKKPGSHTPQPTNKDRKLSPAQSANQELEVEYDIYEMAESGMLIKFPKKQRGYNQETLNSDNPSPPTQPLEKDLEVEYDVYEMAESGMLIKFPKNHDDLPGLKKALSKIWARLKEIIRPPLDSSEVGN